jgi:hypothetical protein
MKYCVTTKDWTTNPFSYGIGVFQGCVVSPTLFLMVYQLVLDYVEQYGTQPYTFKTVENELKHLHDEINILQLAYADDHTLVNSHHSGTQSSLILRQPIYTWTRCLILKASKCYSLALGDRRLLNIDGAKGKSFGPYDPKLTADGTPQGAPIACLNDKPFKFLGKKIWANLKDNLAIEELIKTFKEKMLKIDEQPLNGPSKAWIYSHLVVSQLLWPFTIYDFSVDSVMPMHNLATKLLKKWLGMNIPANPAILYLPREHHGLGIPSIIDKLKAMQIIKLHLVQNSSDLCTKSVSSVVAVKSHSRSATSWNPSLALAKFESQLVFEAKFGGRKLGKFGLGYDKRKRNFSEASLKQKREMVLRYLEAENSHQILVGLYGLALSGNFTKWDESMNSCRNWHTSIFGMQEETLAFALNAQTLTLADPSNLRRWGIIRIAICPLCGKLNATSKHILSGCIISLNSGRYKWRHDNVLKMMYPHLAKLCQIFNKQVKQSGINHNFKSIVFVKEGEKGRPKAKQAKPLSGLLALAFDWQLLIDDVTGKISLPSAVGFDSSDRPDIIIFSISQKIIIWAELTVPLEENIMNARLRKTAKYQKLAVALRLQGWKVYDFTIEVGSIGYVSQSFGYFLRKLPISSSEVKKIEKEASLVALRSSYFIWSSRLFSDWDPPLLVSNVFPLPD